MSLLPLEKYQVIQVLTRTLRAYSPNSSTQEITEVAEKIIEDLETAGWSIHVWEDVIPF